MKNQITPIILFIVLLFAGCSEDFLEAKPNSSIVNPVSVSDYQALLDNFTALNTTGALAQLSADEYFIVNKTRFDALSIQEKNAYTWNKDIYAGEKGIRDWNQPYRAVFYANSVLDGIKKINQQSASNIEWKNLKGTALFFRAYAFYDLVKNFCGVYRKETAQTELGIPLKLTANINESKQRSSLQEAFDQILADLKEAGTLLRDDFSTNDRNRPSKVAVNAMLARVYLYMGEFEQAGIAADACLLKYSKLIDYNKVSTSSATPFSYNTDETIFQSSQVNIYSNTTAYTTSFTAIGVNPDLLATYDPNDLRSFIFYGKNTLNNFNVKRGYTSGTYAFTGLAVDEIILIRAECLARSRAYEEAMKVINMLLINRFKMDPVTGKTSYNNQMASSVEEALAIILMERRKELVWRGLRWSDLKRLNKDGAAIVLKRNLNGIDYTLSPNSALYVFPIPDDEVALSGIKQNIR